LAPAVRAAKFNVKYFYDAIDPSIFEELGVSKK
jgi:hypothetical protein